MKKIILHWNGGTNYPNDVDRQHYHYMIDKDGKIHEGKFKPEDNLDCKDGKYAQHTGGGNTGAIGVSFCGMNGFQNCLKVGDYPLTEIQIESGFKFVAELSKKYAIPIDPLTIMTHYEFGLKNPKTSSVGKIDLTYLDTHRELEKNQVGNHIRKKIKWYLSQIS